MYDWLPIIAPSWIAGSLLALLSAPLGCLVLWRRMAFFSDALSHGTLLGVGIALWLQLPNGLGIAIVSALVVLILTVIEDKRLPSDALLTVVAVSLLCSGLLLLTQLTQQQANILGYLFGNLLDLSWNSLPWLTFIIGFGLICLKMIWRPQVLLASNEDLACIQGINPVKQRLFFMGLLAGFCAVALQAVGSLLISGMLVLPALTARLWSQSPKSMVIASLILAQVAVTTGIWSSVWLDLQTGLSIVLTLAILFFISLFISKINPSKYFAKISKKLIKK